METGKKKWDIWLLLGVPAVALCLFALLWLLPGAGQSVEIQVAGKRYATLPLATDVTLTVPGADGGHCVVTVAGGQVTVTSATCPDQICVHHHAISCAGQSIVCLPEKIVVTVTGGTSAVDGEV